MRHAFPPHSAVLVFTLLGAACASQTDVEVEAGAGAGTRAPVTTPAAPPLAAEAAWKPDGLVFEHHARGGRIHVAASAAGRATLAAGGELPYSRTLVGEGPQGETVVFEVDPDEPALQEWLQEEFFARHGYAQLEREGRIHVTAFPQSYRAISRGGELPYSKNLIGEGPAQETVVIEIHPDRPELQERLRAEFDVRNFYREIESDGRLWVFGTRAAYDSFRETRILPYSVTDIGGGPRGMTVVFEVDTEDEALQKRLRRTYDLRHPFYREVQHDGRIYVLGTQGGFSGFLATRHLSYSRTLIGGGPGGKTVVFEADREDDAMELRLEEEFRRRHGL